LAWNKAAVGVHRLEGRCCLFFELLRDAGLQRSPMTWVTGDELAEIILCHFLIYIVVVLRGYYKLLKLSLGCVEFCLIVASTSELFLTLPLLDSVLPLLLESDVF
jgi:hypothetical protein